MIVITSYLYLCLAVFIGLHVWGFIEDRWRGPDPKFGYNIQLKFTFFNGLVCLFSCPIVNIVLLWLFFWPRKGAR